MKVIADLRAWEKLKKNFIAASTVEGQCGWFEADRYGPENESLPMAQVAKWNEEGHINGGVFAGTVSPPRPFMRVGFKNAIQTGSLRKEFQSLAFSVAEGSSPKTALTNIAAKVKAVLALTMREWNEPGNAPATIEIKGFNNPLFHTQALYNAINYRVEKSEDGVSRR